MGQQRNITVLDNDRGDRLVAEHLKQAITAITATGHTEESARQIIDMMAVETHKMAFAMLPSATVHQLAAIWGAGTALGVAELLIDGHISEGQVSEVAEIFWSSFRQRMPEAKQRIAAFKAEFEKQRKAAEDARARAEAAQGKRPERSDGLKQTRSGLYVPKSMLKE